MSSWQSIAYKIHKVVLIDGRGVHENHKFKITPEYNQLMSILIVFRDTEATSVGRVIITELILIVVCHYLSFVVRGMFLVRQ
jgi:hypothetical protein